MKKFFFALMAAAAVMTVSCNKPGDEQNEGKDEGSKLPKPEYRIKTMANNWEDTWTFSYDAEGKVIDVTRGEPGKHWIFNYKSATALEINLEKDNKLLYEITLNKDGFASEIKDYSGSSVKTYEYDYNKDGFMVKCLVDGKEKTLQTITDGNVEHWDRIGLTKEDGTILWREKRHEYYTELNKGGIHTEWAEDAQMDRWFWETGLLGRASVNVCKTAWWWGIKDEENMVIKDEMAEKLAYNPLELDANGCVAKECKYYDKAEKYKTDPTSMDLEGYNTFTYEKIQ
ncbi:MAG: hypothetical protein IKR38_02060 [Bacteroidales bacterium]|nr:hypothetical protein [Bacteroidales bacterium]